VLNRDFSVRIVSLTQAPVSAAAATVTGLAAFAAVAMDAGWQFVRHGTVVAHEGARRARFTGVAGGKMLVILA
jgi:hypothetical protein